MTVIIKQMKIQITPQHRHSVAINKYYCLLQEVQSNPHALIKKVIILFILLNMFYLSTKERPAGFCILVTNISMMGLYLLITVIPFTPKCSKTVR